MSRRFLFALVALATVAGAAGAASGPWVGDTPSRVRLVSRWSAAAPGGDAGLGLEFRLAPGWHVYWKNAGDAGYAPRVDLADGPLDGLELLYPAPRRFDLPGGLVAFGYEDEVVHPLAANVTGAADPTATLAADIDYLACAEQCIPFRARVTLDLPLAPQPAVDVAIAPLVDRWVDRLPVAVAELAGSVAAGELRRSTGPELDLRLTLDAEDLTPADPDLFFAPHPLLVVGRAAWQDDEHGGTFDVHLRPLDETRPLPERLELEWTATGFELDGRPVALAGTLALARPLDDGAASAPLRWTLAVVVLALVTLFLLRRRHGAVVAPNSD